LEEFDNSVIWPSIAIGAIMEDWNSVSYRGEWWKIQIKTAHCPLLSILVRFVIWFLLFEICPLLFALIALQVDFCYLIFVIWYFWKFRPRGAFCCKWKLPGAIWNLSFVIWDFWISRPWGAFCCGWTFPEAIWNLSFVIWDFWIFRSWGTFCCGWKLPGAIWSLSFHALLYSLCARQLRTQNKEHWTLNTEHWTPNTEHRTPNNL